MYAIIRDGGRQYKVSPEDEIKIDYRELNDGDKVEFDDVLAVSNAAGLAVGKPTLAGAKVVGTFVRDEKGPKLTVQKMRRRTNNSRTKTGHRQKYVRVKIESITGGE
jgi:large subunit ribosomal protein L21